jgi:hypothetical protein
VENRFPLGIEQKKGDPNRLDGRLIVYASIDIDPSEIINMKHPVASMVHNGLLVAQGNFKEQSNLRDFLKSEMGVSLEEGLEQIIDKLDGLEAALDPQKLKEKLENMDELQDFIPTPAKIVPFHSEEEMMEQEGDVFWTGYFKNIGNAVLSVNAFPIFYQARYREQEIESIRSEIENLIAQVEGNQTTGEHFTQSDIDPAERIEKTFIPNLLHNRNNTKEFKKTVEEFRRFLSGYPYSDDIENIISMISETDELTEKQLRILDLYAKKVKAVYREEFKEAEKIREQIKALETS